MKKQSLKKIILFTIGMAFFLILTIFCCVQYTGNRMTAFSFQRLKEMTEDVAREYREEIDTDFAILRSMAAVLAVGDITDTRLAATVLNTFEEREPYIRIQLLNADSRLLTEDGNWTDVSGIVDFASEISKGEYLSGRCMDFIAQDMFVMRMAVPVIKGEEAVAVLYGVLSLQEASRVYKVNDFGGNAFVLLVDGASGDVILDTWHETLNNIKNYSERDIKFGDSIYDALDNMQHDVGGNLAFTSATRGKTIYLHYEPVGINNLSAIIGVLENIALKETRTIAETLYTMAVIIFVVLVFYTIIIVSFLVHINRRVWCMSITDKGTGLFNRDAYENYLLKNSTKTFPSIACIYLDANGLHELNNRLGHAAGDAMLLAVADGMRKIWPDSGLYRIGGDEFVVFPKDTDEQVCMQGINQLCEELEKQGYSVSAGFAYRENETGINRVVTEADERMLSNKEKYHLENDLRRPR